MGGNSGAGSYNKIAAFKAEIVNAFVVSNGVQHVFELGFGDGQQLSMAKSGFSRELDATSPSRSCCVPSPPPPPPAVRGNHAILGRHYIPKVPKILWC